MSHGKRIFLRLAGGVLVFLVLLASLLFLLPKLIGQEWSREKIAREASALVGGTVEIQAADLSYWPHPHITIQGAKLAIPGTASGTIRSLTAYPRIIPLLWGTVRFSEVRVEAPVFTVTIPEKTARTPEKEKDVSASASLEKSLRSVLDSMARSAPNVRLVLTDGRVDLSGGSFPPLSFRGIEGNAVLPPAGPDLDLSCTGTLWERASVKGIFKGGSLAGKGQIVLKGFRPHLLAGYLFPGSGSGMSDSDMDLDLRVEADGWAKLEARGDVSLHRMALYRGKKKLELTGGTIRGTLDRDGEKITGALTQFSLDSPRLVLSGNISLDGESRRSSADAQARQVDLASVREHALALAGDVPLVADIFSIVKAGTIPALVFHAEGETSDDLWDLENMEFTGSILEGKVTVDAGNANLNIDRVRGNLALSRGILTASSLEGNLGHITASKGTLRLGFLGDDPPFHLETDVSVDAAELPPLLNLLISSDPFREEMSRVEGLKGNASGRLLLGETVNSIQVTVKVDAMSLSAKYDRLPYPLTVSGGRLLYRGDEIAVTGAQGKMGESTFSDLSWTVRMTDPLALEVRSGMFRLSLDELYPWARATEGLRESFAKVQDLGGIAALSVTHLEGPAFAPAEWRFDATGNVERLSLTTPSVPGAIDVAQGNFRATRETLFFEDIRTKFLDASVSVSGSLDDYRKDAQRGVATVSGRLGPETIGFLHDRGKIPPDFLVHPPLEASGVRLEWQKDALVALSGNFVVGNRPKVSIDLRHPPGEWIVRKLSILDEDSKASLSLHWKPGSLDFTFEGHLSRETVNRIIVSGSSPSGWLKGDFRASVWPDQPMHSTAQGTLEGGNLGFLQWFGIPVFVDSISLSAEGSRLAVQAAKITIGDNHVLLKGDATASPEGLAFDMDASSPGLDWESLRDAFESSETKEASPGTESGAGERAWNVPVRGTVRLRAGYFRYGRHTVEPAAAEIVFGKSGLTFTTTDAAYCGIPFTGTLSAIPGETSFEIRPNAKEGDADSVYDCLTDDKGRITGRFDLSGKVEGRVREGDDPVRSLRGNLDFTTRDGKIFGTPIFTRVFSFLNLTELFRGKVPDMVTKGLDYNSYTIRGDLRDGDFTITESVLDGKTIDVVSEGRINIDTGKCDITMLVAPFTTMNYVIGKIPLLGYILGGSLVEVPVKVSGTTADPKVSLLEPAAVGKNLLGIVKRIFLLPAELVRPLLPGEKSVNP
ncbi:MAG: AsmA-like C-terminal domain-containing protein [Candidatus Deferrimicrobiaceae bacterium]